MRSIGARIALWYTGAATLTLACVFVVGYHYLGKHLVHGLDLLNESEFRQIQAHLGPEVKTMSAPFLELRVREITDNASALFFIEFHPAAGGVLHSFNLGEHDIPELAGQPRFTAGVGDLGEMRIGQFLWPPFRLVIATPMAPVNEVMANYVQVCLMLLAAMALVSLAIGSGLSRLMLRPVRLIRETADRIRSDNLGQRIPVSGVRDEISDVAQLLNQMFDRLETSFTQIRRFTAEASHELKTPLSLIRLHAENMLRDSGLASVHRESAQAQVEEIMRLNRLVEDLLLLARADAHAIRLELRRIDPREFIDGFAQDAAVLAEHRGMRFVHTSEGSGEVDVEPQWMHQVLLNLLTNALNVSPPGSLVTLHSGVTPEAWQIRIDDEGPGLPEAERERVFERFVQQRPAGPARGGSGLGLAICRSIVQLHGGTIAALGRPAGTGLRVQIALPRRAQA